MPRVSNLPKRFRKFINDTGGCWLWTGRLVTNGYARVYVDGRTIAAHKHIWTLFNGAWPENMVGDHLCGVRHCVNPEHIEPTTQSENIRRAVGRTHCKSGHERVNVSDSGTCKKCVPSYVENFVNTSVRCTMCDKPLKYYSVSSHMRNIHGVYKRGKNVTKSI